ncbi:ANK REP REGION domain-containing protein [Citrus sinensis]|nr:ANK REP REGION domain-containing protein [Citrus sinensis]
MEPPSEQQQSWKKMKKQLTAKRDDTPLQSLVRTGSVELVLDMISSYGDMELREMLSKMNQSGETALYVAAEYGYVDMVREMIRYHDTSLAGIKARNGYDAFHIAAKQGCLEVLKILMEALPELLMTFDSSNTTALHTASSQGHVEVVKFLLEKGSTLATIARSNGKTALHSAARNGHLEIVKALLSKEPGIVLRNDKKGQTALHMAVKGQSIELVDELVKVDPVIINMVDAKGNSALHIATRKGRVQKTGHSEIGVILKEHGVPCGKSIKPQANSARELKQAVSDIKHEVHDQLEHTRETRKHVHGIAKRINKMHTEGLNNAINSTTVVAVLIATVAFAAIFSVPGQFADKPDELPPKVSPGEAHIAPKTPFLIFIIFDSIALFISLAVVIVQTSVVVIERKAKKQMMAVINKLMWLACIMISVAFLALSYIVVGDDGRGWAVAVTFIGTVIMVSTIGTMSYWVIVNRIEASKIRSIRRSSMDSGSRSMSASVMLDSEFLNNEIKLYAV